MAERINMVWLKRDLRLSDHKPLKAAIEEGLPVLMVYIFEPSLLRSDHSDDRHWRFVVDSIHDMNQRLKPYNLSVNMMYGEVIPVFQKIINHYKVQNVFSHQETGLWLTYQRDLQVKAFLKQQGVTWDEFQHNAVIRGLKHRKDWDKRRRDFLAQPQEHPALEKLPPFSPAGDVLNPFSADAWLTTLSTSSLMQRGGETRAQQWLQSFLQERHHGYNKMVSKPTESRYQGSRLSPYLAWGNLSIRQVEQARRQAYAGSKAKRDLLSFKSRLAWHDHFIQKLEAEPESEWQNTNPAFNEIRNAWDEMYFQAWKSGMTGYPLVDACMRCVIETGYINFRMRSMLVSFLTHHLWLDWREGAKHLSRQFLDFEPGIHFSQFQMQAGTTGINTIRIYNPVKQAKDHDPEAHFIKKWVPELKHLPAAFALEPWLVSSFEEVEYGFQYGWDYPKRIVNTEETYRYASRELWRIKKSRQAQANAVKILEKHVRPRDSRRSTNKQKGL